jgi:hypothetical protein
MAIKLIRTCDRLGCVIDTAPIAEGESLPPTTTVGYTVLKTITNEKGETYTEKLVDFNEVCAQSVEEIEYHILGIKNEKRPRRKKEATAADAGSEETEAEAAPKERRKPGPKPGAKRGRPRKVDTETATATPKVEEAEEDEPEILDVNDVLRDSVANGVRKGVESLKAKEKEAKAAPVKAEAAAEAEEEPDPEAELDTFETDSGQIVNADTGEVVASPVDGEEVEEEEPSGPINGVEAHPF